MFDLLSGERLRLYIAINIIRSFMFDAKVDNRVNSIKGTSLTREDTPKRTIIAGHIVARIILLLFGIQRGFAFPQKKSKESEFADHKVSSARLTSDGCWYLQPLKLWKVYFE